MLILVAITINIVINGRLIGYARNERETQESEQEKETYGVHIGDTINYNFLKSGQATSVTVNTEETGYYTEKTYNDETGRVEPVNYDQTFILPTENNLTWKVIGIENGHILISPTTATVENLFLAGKNGVTNGVNILNKISALYGHGDYAEETMYTYGNETSGARSITVEDINNLTGYNVKEDDICKDIYGVKWQYKLVADEEAEGQNNVQYSTDNGTTWKDCVDWLNNKTTSFEYYKNGNWGELTEMDDLVELENTNYAYWPKDTYKDLAYFVGTKHWVASPATLCNSEKAKWGLFVMNGKGSYASLSPEFLYDAYGNTSYFEFAVRPVVSLKSNIQLAETTSGSGVWNITGTN